MSLFDSSPMAVTIGHVVYFPDPKAYQRGEPNARAALLAHELTHVKQWEEKGTVGFLKEYFQEYLRTQRQGVDTHDPQQGISLEREAISVEREIYNELIGVK